MIDALLRELDREMAATRAILECVPDEKFAWRPHEKSSTLGKLANHMATFPAFGTLVVTGGGMKKPLEITSRAELLQSFDNNVAQFRAALAGVEESRLTAMVPLTPETSRHRIDILRERVLNHLVHHRGQLTVYLRLLDVPVPGMYGPTADDKA